jgi:nucleotide-binding universal stress UspA family protein
MKLSPDAVLLCGTDFSSNARKAAEVAAALAVRTGRPLHLLHVSEAAGDGLDGARSEGEAVARALRASGATVVADVRPGLEPEEILLARCRVEPFPELLVLAPVSKVALDRWTLGSVSERVAEAAPVPTLLVRRPDPLLAWARDGAPLRVFVAVDQSDSSRAALRWVRGLAALAPCIVTVGCVVWPPGEKARLGHDGPMGLTENPPAVQGVLERDLAEFVAGELGAAPDRLVVQPGWGREDAYLIQMAGREAADLFVVGTRQRTGLRRWTRTSVSRGVARHAPMNVVCVPQTLSSAPAVRRCRRVMVAVEPGSPENRRLIALGCSLAGAEVFLVSVIESGPPPNPLIGGRLTGGASAETVARRVQEVRRELGEAIPAGVDAAGLTVHVHVEVESDIPSGLCAAAEKLNAEVVCLAARNRPGLMATVLGSVSQAVLQTCRRPVLVAWPAE